MKLSALCRFFVPLMVIFFLALALTGEVESAEDKEKKICEDILHQELQDMLTKINIREAGILYVKESPLTGVCEVAIDRGGQPAIFYVTATRSHMLLGSMLETKTMVNLTAQAAKLIQDKKRIDISAISLEKALIMGDPRAAKKVIIFTDPDCNFCSALHEVIKQIVAKRKDIVFFIKMYPLDSHKDAYWKSKSIVCSRSMQMLEDCFAKKEIEKIDCATNEVDETIKFAKSNGITATPAIILPDGRLRLGTMPEQDLTNLIDGKM